MATKAELEAEVQALRAQLPQESNVKPPVIPEDVEAQPDPWAALSRPFDPQVVRKHPHSNFHYLSIDTVMNRLDEVLGPNWTLAVQGVSCAPVDPAWKTYGRKEQTAFLATATVRISALIANNIHTVRDGVGADFADDPDKAIKTALANAVKKAANGFGVGRYLWDAEERAAIDEANAARNDVKALKRQVVELAENQSLSLDGLTPSEKLEALANHFQVDKSDLASAETLNKILEG